MKRLILAILVCITRALCSYTDSEIEELLASLSNPFNPTLEDYRLIEHYFQYGERPYLETMRKVTHIPAADMDFRVKQLRSCMLVGQNGEMPIFQLHACNVRPDTEDRCILIYATYNSFYPGRALRLFEELKECGYSGHIMLRIGGIPDISNGGARLCTIPYTWRINFFKEALRKGFTKILYLDACLHPLSDFSLVFDIMEDEGLFSCSTGDWPWDQFTEYFPRIDVPFERRHEMPWLYGYAHGLNFANEKIQQLFQLWDEKSHEIEDFCCMGDDVFFTCLAWKFGFRPQFEFGEVVGASDFHPSAGYFPPSILFYQDNHRVLIRSGFSSVYD